MLVSPLMRRPRTFLSKGSSLTTPCSLISCLLLRHPAFIVFSLPGFQFPKHRGYWALPLASRGQRVPELPRMLEKLQDSGHQDLGSSL